MPRTIIATKNCRVRILFWGTPEFAAPSLRALVGEGFDVAGVVTQPDKPVGRSRSTVRQPPVKRVALEEGLDVLQPERPTSEGVLAAVDRMSPDISVVVAYGHILPESLITLPRLGTINVHASLLPALRGAAPIQAAMRLGLEQTGISIMRMVRRLDAGPVLHRVTTPIAPDETGGELTLRLSEIGALAAVEALAMIDLGRVVEAPQDERHATYAPKIERAMTRVQWTAPAREVARLVQAYDPVPGSFAFYGSAPVKLFGATVVGRPAGGEMTDPGTVLEIDSVGMTVACGVGAVRIAAIQPAGKRQMTPVAWAHGRGIASGQRLS